MKMFGKGVLGALALLLLSNTSAFAIEGLQISVQCSNVVLRWPSDEFNGETFIVQYRPDLTSTNAWITLTNQMPPDANTNITYFVHSNIVQHPNCSGSGGGSFAAMAAQGRSSGLAMAVTKAEPPPPTEPMVMRADGSSPALPLAIYPPGFDISGMLVYDPLISDWVFGSQYSRPSNVLRNSRAGLAMTDGIDPTGGDTNADGGETTSVPDMGFYQVVREGVYVLGTSLASLTNGPVSDTIALAFEAGNDVGILQEITAIVDGTRYRGVTPLIAPGISGSLKLDTSFLENGDHTFQVMVGWQNLDIFDVNTPVIHRYSDPFTLTVSNVIYYPDWQDEIGELGFAHYSFKTTCTNSYWQIDIYDVSNHLAKVLIGNTAEGIVETNWDMVDLNGVTRGTNDVDSEFSATITVGDPTTKAAPKQQKAAAYPDHAKWAIVYEDLIGNMANSNAMRSAISGFGSLGATAGGSVSVFPTPGHPEYGQTFPIRFPWTNNPSPPTIAQKYADEKALISLLTNNVNRNFYFHGHGEPNKLYSIDVNALTFYLQKHFYRFVFLNGCSTAAGGLPAAFGINFNSTKDINYFQTNGIRPRTFLGYSKDVFYASSGTYYDSSTGQTYSGGRVEQRCIDFLNNLEFYWYFYYDLSTSIYHAQLDTPDLRYGWLDGPELVLYGYPWLYLDQYNYRTDWSN